MMRYSAIIYFFKSFHQDMHVLESGPDEAANNRVFIGPIAERLGMFSVAAHEFGNGELSTLLQSQQGPVDTFPLEPKAKEQYKQRAIERGELEGVLFDDCPAFDKGSQKSIRREVRRAEKVYNTLVEA